MKALLVAAALVLLPTTLGAGTLMRIHVLHERPRGVPTQTITVFFWPAPEDRILQLMAVDPDTMRVSSVPLHGTESKGPFIFVWRLRPTVMRDEATEPYTVTAATADEDGNVTGSATVRFFVS